MYFINHRYDGVQLWQLQSDELVHQLVWLSNFISFFFLYPSTFNLLEVAAVDKPKMHLWETGIMRITRHPQVGYFLYLFLCIYTNLLFLSTSNLFSMKLKNLVIFILYFNQSVNMWTTQLIILVTCEFFVATIRLDTFGCQHVVFWPTHVE